MTEKQNTPPVRITDVDDLENYIARQNETILALGNLVRAMGSQNQTPHGIGRRPSRYGIAAGANTVSINTLGAGGFYGILRSQVWIVIRQPGLR